MTFLRFKRQLHFVTGFFIRNAGEVGLVLFLCMFGLLTAAGIKHQLKFEMLATTVAAIGAFAAFLAQQRSKMRDIIKSIDDEFTDLEASRIQFSKQMLKHKWLSCPADYAEIDPVLDFFDTMGSLIRTGALTFIMADETYTYWAVRYFTLCLPRIRFRQTVDDYCYKSFEWFVDRIPDTDKGKVDGSALRLFLEEESNP